LRFWSAKQSSSIGMQIELSLQSRAHFVNFIFQKCCHPLRFFAILEGKSSSRHFPVHFFWATFADRGLHTQKQRPSFGDPTSQ
jgi:hypothetical protein